MPWTTYQGTKDKTMRRQQGEVVHKRSGESQSVPRPPRRAWEIPHRQSAQLPRAPLFLRSISNQPPPPEGEETKREGNVGRRVSRHIRSSGLHEHCVMSPGAIREQGAAIRIGCALNLSRTPAFSPTTRSTSSMASLLMQAGVNQHSTPHTLVHDMIAPRAYSRSTV